jgi:hypothetical protein
MPTIGETSTGSSANGGIAFAVVAHSLLITALWAVGSCLNVNVPMGLYFAIVLGWLCWPVIALSNGSRVAVIALVIGMLIIAAPIAELVSLITCLDCRHRDFCKEIRA